MKTDQEIKDWIDSKKVLSKIDVAGFIYGEKNKRDRTAYPKINKYWDYVLRTKDATLLRKYRDKRIKEGNARKDRDNIRKIIRTDERFKCGSRRAVRLMNDVYNIKVSRGAIANYLREYV